MYITIVNMVGGQEKCRLSPLSTFFQSFFVNDGTTATNKPGRDKEIAFWVSFTCVTPLAFLSYFGGIIGQLSSLSLYHNNSMLS